MHHLTNPANRGCSRTGAEEPGSQGASFRAGEPMWVDDRKAYVVRLNFGKAAGQGRQGEKALVVECPRFNRGLEKL